MGIWRVSCWKGKIDEPNPLSYLSYIYLYILLFFVYSWPNFVYLWTHHLSLYMFHLPWKFGEVQTTGEFAGLRAFQYLTGVGDPPVSLCSICFGGKDFLCRMVPQISRDNLKNSKNGSFEGWKGGVGLKDQETRRGAWFLGRWRKVGWYN